MGSFYIDKSGRDASTDAIETIDYAHHEIHGGSHFLYTDAVSLNSAETQYYLITTPNTNKWAHLVFEFDGSAITQWQVYEGSDKAGSTLQAVFNSNRNSVTTATVTVHKAVTGGTTDGTQIFIYKGGAASAQSRTSTDTGSRQEIILKRNTKYTIIVTSGTNSNLTNIRLEWYEHTNRNL